MLATLISNGASLGNRAQSVLGFAHRSDFDRRNLGDAARESLRRRSRFRNQPLVLSFEGWDSGRPGGDCCDGGGFSTR